MQVMGRIMGNAQESTMAHSTCTQRHIGKPIRASREFNSGQTNEIVLVLIPSQATFFKFFYTVPSGFWILCHQWGKSAGELQAGLHMFYPAYKNISFIVTKQRVTYNAPTRQCPTADNIMVDIDLSLSFSIGPTIEDAYNFAYNMGAVRLDAFIHAQAEEAIRGLVYSVTHDHVHDLREEFATDVLDTLKAKCSPYGVQVQTVKITDVKLPRVLMEKFEVTTSFKTKISEQRKRHENTIRVIKDHAQQDLQELIKTNARLKQDLDSQISRFRTEEIQHTLDEKGKATVKILEFKNRREVAITKNQGNLEAAKLNSTRDGEEIRKITSIECDEKMVQAANYAEVTMLDSQGSLYASAKSAEKDVVSAQAEAVKSAALVEKRDFDLAKEQMGLLADIGSTGRKFITGEHGKRIMSECIPKPIKQLGRK